MSIEFNKTVAVTGGTAVNLLTLMQANGFPANVDMKSSIIGTELRYKAPAAQSLFTGSSSSVDASTGDELDAGVWSTERATGFLGDLIDPTQKYLFVATTSNVGIFFRAK